MPEIINLDNKYYIAEISNTENRVFNDPEVTFKRSLNFKTKLKTILHP